MRTHNYMYILCLFYFNMTVYLGIPTNQPANQHIMAESPVAFSRERTVSVISIYLSNISNNSLLFEMGEKRRKEIGGINIFRRFNFLFPASQIENIFLMAGSFLEKENDNGEWNSAQTQHQHQQQQQQQ